jgi:hypothetical protein
MLTQLGPRQQRKRSKPARNEGSSIETDGIPTGAP